MNTSIERVGFFLTLFLSQASAASDNIGAFTDRIIVKMKSPSNASASFVANSHSTTLSSKQVSALSAMADQPIQYSHAMSNKKAHVMKLDGFKSVQQVEQLAKEMMAGNDNIEYAEPDYLMFPSSVVPNDPGFVDQWSFQGIDQQGINLSNAWQHTTGSSDVVVAVVDSGILAGHPDFDADRILPGYDFISSGIKANDGDGRDSDPSDPGDWVTQVESDDSSSPLNGCPVENSSWHGTHVAGTIGASTNNNVGVSGVDWAAKILPVRVLGKCGGYSSDIAEGIIWAAGGSVNSVPNNEHPADVINLSLGGAGFCTHTMQSAINIAYDAGAALVVAAGNESSSTAFSSPANCNNVIVVGAHDNQGHLSDFSNYGSEVDILAPGGSNQNFDCAANSIVSLFNEGSQSPTVNAYACNIGTSMAAPHVSGVAALMLSRNPALTPSEIEEIIKISSRNYSLSSGCSNSRCGSGLIDADAAIKASAIPLVPSNFLALYENGVVILTWQDESDLESGFKIEASNNAGPYQLVTITGEGASSYSHTDLSSGEMSYRLTAINDIFSSAPAQLQTVNVPSPPSSSRSTFLGALSNVYLLLLAGLLLYRRRS